MVKRGSGITPQMEEDVLQFIRESQSKYRDDLYLFLVDFMHERYGGVWKCNMSARVEDSVSDAGYIFHVARSSAHSMCIDRYGRRLFLWKKTKERDEPPRPPSAKRPEPPPHDRDIAKELNI